MLSDAEVRNTKPAGAPQKLWDAGGLFLFVTKNGRKSWRLKYRFGGKEKLLTFGLYPEIKLPQARARRDEAREILRLNKDPAVEFEKRKRQAVTAASATFRAAAEAWLEDERPGWSPGYAERITNRLELDLYPALGKLPIGDIDGSMVLRELRKIEKRGSIETARRVRGYVEAIFRRAKGERLIGGEAVLDIGEIRDALKPARAGAKQPALLTPPELLELQLDVDRSLSSSLTKLASRLLALTAVRVGVVRGATWTEFEGIDWDKPDAAAPDALWKIPAARMKLEVEDKGNVAFGHDVPLVAQAVDVLRALRPISGHRALVFPSDKSWRAAMSDSAVSSMYRRIRGGRYRGQMVPHGWRSAFSTIMNERAARLGRDGDRMLVDIFLAHVPKGMSASEWAYNRARYLGPRRDLAAAWAEIITDGLPSPWTLVGLEPSWVRHRPALRVRQDAP